VPGAIRQEKLRHECEDLAGTGPISWAGQLAAISAYAATLLGPARYLICDTGGTGVRAGRFSVSEGTVRIEATHAEDAGGWRDFDAGIRAEPRGAGLPADWYEQAKARQSRARRVFKRAAEYPDEALSTRVYEIAGPFGLIDSNAGQLIGCFAPTLQRLRAATAAVLGAARPDRVVLTGGLCWLPLAAQGIADSTGVEPTVLGLDATARGAMLFATGRLASLSPRDASRSACQHTACETVSWRRSA
jgi:hypothetical protein